LRGNSTLVAVFVRWNSLELIIEVNLHTLKGFHKLRGIVLH